MFNRTSVLTVCAVGAVALLIAASSQAWTPISRATHLTLTRTVALPGVVLGPGAYTFELVPQSGGRPDIVRVSSRDGRVWYTGFTMLVARPAEMPKDRVLTFGEALAGEPTPIAAWFPIGESTGHHFLYR